MFLFFITTLTWNYKDTFYLFNDYSYLNTVEKVVKLYETLFLDFINEKVWILSIFVFF